MSPNNHYSVRVEWSQPLGRWVAVFEDPKTRLSVEFPLTDTYTGYSDNQVLRHGIMTGDEERALSLIFLRLVQNKIEAIEAQLAGPMNQTALERAMRPEAPTEPGA